CERAARAAACRDFRTASWVTQQALTTATSPPPAVSTCPSRTSLSRTACASACETLQPRNCTENVATAPRTLTRSAPGRGGQAGLGPRVDRPVVRQVRSLGGEVPGRDQRRGAQARADSLDGAAGDVGDDDVGDWKDRGVGVVEPDVDGDAVRRGVSTR